MNQTASGFPLTSWTVLKGCREEDAARRKSSLDRLIGLYWKPVYWTLRRTWAGSDEDAKDLTQDFFTEVVLKSSFLDRASPHLGSFRSFVKGAVRKFAQHAVRDGLALKRGGGAVISSLDQAGLEFEPAGNGTPEETFDQAWESVVLERALQILEQNLSSRGRGLSWKVFEAYDLTSDPEVSYESLGRTFGIPPETVKESLKRTRKELLSIAREILKDGVDSPEALDLELRTLFGS
jgi:RNA polymerase sigma factor (sigma-70 family)